MGKFTIEEIQIQQHPFAELIEEEGLIENIGVLNNLTLEEMNQLAEKMLLDCPADKLKFFQHQIESVRFPKNNFFDCLMGAYQVAGAAHSLLDEKNKLPYKSFVGREFNADLFNQFPNILPTLIKGKEITIATHLTLTTPIKLDIQSLEPDFRYALIRNLMAIAPRSLLTQTLGSAFELDHNIRTKLLGNNPSDFFSQTNCNPDQVAQFSELVNVLLQGKEEGIGMKLAHSPIEKRNEIAKTLEQLTVNALNSNNPFKLISKAFNTALAPKESEEKTAVSSNRNALFNDTHYTQIPKTSAPTRQSMEEMDEEDFNNHAKEENESHSREPSVGNIFPCCF